MYRRLFQFTKAKDIYIEVLKASNTMLNIQVEAAKLYQDWAALAKDEDKTALYMRAMGGSEKDPTSGRGILGLGPFVPDGGQVPAVPRRVPRSPLQSGLLPLQPVPRPDLKSEQQEHLNKAKDNMLQTQQLFGSGPEWDAWKPWKCFL